MKIIELNLPSTNIAAQYHMFSTILGFDCEYQADQRLTINCGDNQLNFVAADKQFYFHYCFLVPTGCIGAICDFLDEREFESLLFRGERIVNFSDGKSVYFYDADGNIAEFIQRPSLKLPAKSDFQIEDVVRLNEIGVPADNPVELAKYYVDRFGIELLDDGVYRDDFVWCGDYEGVLLIPKVGRNWMPTDQAAEKNDLFVRFQTASGVHEIEISGN